MNRHERRATKARKLDIGTRIDTQTVRTTTGDFYWFECPENFSLEDDGLPPGTAMHGPFKTEAEVAEDQRLTLLGPQCVVTEGGEWDPNWNRVQ
jgi:hypothetical protein